MELGLKEKVVIITGGARGIGAACVRAFSDEGAIPVIAGRAAETASALLDDFKVGLAIETELGDDEASLEVVEKTIERFGRIDGIVHNAACNDGVGLRHPPKEFRESLRVNLYHVFSLTHYALDELINSRGFIVNIGSKVAETGQGGTSGYAASKGALNALTREWALELAEKGIRVNSVVPSEVLTPQYEEWSKTMDDPEKFIDLVRSRIPLGQRMTQAEEIAWAVVFLASERSSHTTGQLVYPDGGYVHLDRSYGNKGV